MERRESDKVESQCPLDHEAVTKLLTTLESIELRLRKIEKYFLVGRVVAWTVGTIAVSVLWFFDRAEDIRASINHFIGHGD